MRRVASWARPSKKDNSSMKRWIVFFAIVLSAFVGRSFPQNNSGQSEPPDLHKPTLDRLESLSRQAEADWRVHADIPHPEDPRGNDSDWGTVTVKNVSGPGGQNEREERWKGTRVFRRWVQIPERINGYATQGSQVNLDLRFGSRSALMITVFSDGAILYRGSDDDIQPVLLSANAQPGQKFLVAARVVADEDAEFEFFHSELT